MQGLDVWELLKVLKYKEFLVKLIKIQASKILKHVCKVRRHVCKV